MSADPGLALRRPRDVGSLLGDALRYYTRNFVTFLAIGATVVVPVYLIVLGLGLEQLFSGYDETPPLGHSAIEAITTYLIVLPLVFAMTTHALLAAEEGRLTGPGGPITAGLESFAPVFAAVLLAAVGIALLLITIVFWVYFYIRWYVVPQAVVVDGRRGPEALTRSGELVRGSWWRTLGVVLLAQIAALVAGTLIQLPFLGGATAADSAALSLAGTVVANTLVAPYSAIVATLLYFDLRARKKAVPAAPAPPIPARDVTVPPDLERPESPLPPERSGRPPSG